MYENMNDANKEMEENVEEHQQTPAEAPEEAPEPIEGEEPENEVEEAPAQNIDFSKERENLEKGGKPERTELEKAMFTYKSVHNKIKELGGDPSAVLNEEAEAPKPAEAPPEGGEPRYATVEDVAKINESIITTQAEAIAASLAKSDDERYVIMHHFHNSIKRTGDLRRDVENAHLIANRGRVATANAERERKETAVPPKPESAGQAPRKEDRPKISRELAARLRSRGLNWNPKTRRYEGKHTYVAFNPQTKAWDDTGKLNK